MAHYIYAVIIAKDIGLEKAFELSREYVYGRRKKEYSVIGDWFWFRNLPKTHFEANSLTTTMLNDDVGIVYGTLK